jgi:C4-dicarboxylate transporter DctM subunit
MTQYVGIFLLFVLLALGVPIAFSLAAAGTIGLIIVSDWNTAANLLLLLPQRIVTNYVLVAIPMFLLFGYIAERTGITNGTFAAAQKWLGWLPAGLALATSASAGVFAAASGSSVSSCAVFGKIAIPEMRKAGYNLAFSMGTVAASGVLAATIPPSITLVLYGMLSQTSIIKLFAAGIIPGICQLFITMTTIFVVAKLKPSLVPPCYEASWKERFSSISGIWPLFSVAVAILASIYLGIATVTESSAAGAMVALIIVTIQRKITIRALWEATILTCRTTAMILLLLVGGLIFATYTSLTSLAPGLVNIISGLTLSPKLLMLLLIPVFLFLGCFLDGSSILVLTVPLLLSISALLELDKIWLGLYLTICIDLGFLTPPVGLNVFVVKGTVEDATLEEAFKGIYPFFIPLVAFLIIIVLFPEIVTWLPNYLG